MKRRRSQTSCPLCDSHDLSVLETRTLDHSKHKLQELGTCIRRRRLCHHCNNQWDTLEIQAELLDYVMRRNRWMAKQLQELQRA